MWLAISQLSCFVLFTALLVEFNEGMKELGSTEPILYGLIYMNDSVFFFAGISFFIKSRMLMPHNHNRMMRNDACVLVADLMIGSISAQILFTPPPELQPQSLF